MNILKLKLASEILLPFTETNKYSPFNAYTVDVNVTGACDDVPIYSNRSYSLTFSNYRCKFTKKEFK